MSWYVYILRCGDGSYYTGSTNDPERRFKAHSSGRGGKYTRSHLPVEPVYVQEVPDKSSALKREIQLKRMSHEEKERLIRGERPAALLPNKKQEETCP